MTFFRDNHLHGRPDLAKWRVDDDALDSLITHLEDELPLLKSRPEVAALIVSCGLTDDDIAALHLLKLEQPYPFYRMYNAWMLGDRRDQDVVENIGPCFNLQYYAVSKLPIVVKKAARGALVNNIPALKSTFDNSEQRLAAGQTLSFWAFSSFSTDNAVISMPRFSGKADEEAIIYTCAALPGVNMEPFKPDGMPAEDEILPLCPAVFTVHVAMKLRNKLHVTLEYDVVRSWERGYVVPTRPKPHPTSPKAETSTLPQAGSDLQAAQPPQPPPSAPVPHSSAYIQSHHSSGYPKYASIYEAASYIDGGASIGILKSLGADINARDNLGCSAVAVAALNGHSEVVKLLHTLGADVTAANSFGQTPVHFAARSNSRDVIITLLFLRADITSCDCQGATPLWTAASNGSYEAVQTLYHAGADVRTPNMFGVTPVQVAEMNGHRRVVNFLNALRLGVSETYPALEALTASGWY